MIRQSIIVQNKLGVHTRAAARIVDTAKKYQSKIELTFRNRVVDCKSIMGVITIGAQKDDAVELMVNGEDEQPAVEAMVKLFNERFGEE